MASYFWLLQFQTSYISYPWNSSALKCMLLDDMRYVTPATDPNNEYNLPLIRKNMSGTNLKVKNYKHFIDRLCFTCILLHKLARVLFNPLLVLSKVRAGNFRKLEGNHVRSASVSLIKSLRSGTESWLNIKSVGSVHIRKPE